MFTIYSARKIITMNVRRPVASHVAVRDGWILGAGTLEELAGWGSHEIDDRFADKVVMPGLVEGHCHSREGSGWDEVYVGFHDRMAPDRVVHTGLASIDEVVGRLQQAERALSGPDEPLLAWGLGPAVLRRAADERGGPRPRLHRAPGLRHASERPHHQREPRADAPRRDRAGYLGDGGDEG